MNVEGISALKAAEIQSNAQVKVAKGAMEQQEAVAAVLIEAIASSLPNGKGQRINIKA